MRTLKSSLAIFFLLSTFFFFNANSAENDDDLFSSNKPLELSLEVDIQSIINDKSEEPEYVPARLLQKGKDIDDIYYDIKVKPRGNTRRLANLCDFPPLKFNFKKSQVSNTIFDGQDKLKFVSQCRQDKKYEEYVLEEYLLYKTYNILTEESYKTRLVNITIKDSNGKARDIKMSGFLIEDQDSFAKRIGLKEYSEVFWSQDSCEENRVDRMSLFQYMIGNTDWHVNVRHNIDVFQNKKDQALIPIPFDFDCSGVIYTEYALPSNQLPIMEVNQRYYKGSARNIEDFNNTIINFNEKRDEIYALYSSFEHLPKYVLKSSLNYYSTFYKIINNENRLEEILGTANRSNAPNNLKVKK